MRRMSTPTVSLRSQRCGVSVADAGADPHMAHKALQVPVVCVCALLDHLSIHSFTQDRTSCTIPTKREPNDITQK